MKTCALIVAAGNSERFGGSLPKQFLQLCGRPVLTRTIERFEEAESIDQILVVVAEESLLFVAEKVVDPYHFRKILKIVPGGATRQESVLNGLERLPGAVDYVAIHDGARPLISPDDIDRVVAQATKSDSALLAEAVTDTVKRAENGFVFATLDRSQLFLAQTPQVFKHEIILKAHRTAAQENSDATDDASLVEAAGYKVRLVQPQSPNPKITTPHDLVMAQTLFERAGYEKS